MHPTPLLLLTLSLPLTSATLPKRHPLPSDSNLSCLDLQLQPCGLNSCIPSTYTCCLWGGGCAPGFYCDLPASGEFGEPGCCPEGVDCRNGGGSSTFTIGPPARPTPVDSEEEVDEVDEVVTWVGPVDATATSTGNQALPTYGWENGELEEDEFGIFDPGEEYGWDEFKTRIDLDIAVPVTTTTGIIIASSTRVPTATATLSASLRINSTTATSTTSIPRFSRPAIVDDDDEDEDEDEEEVFTTTTRRLFSTASSDDAEPTVTGFRASTNAEEKVEEESGAWNVDVESGMSGAVWAGLLGVVGGWLL